MAERAARPRPVEVVIITLILLAADQGLRHASSGVVSEGLFDETAHLMTGLLVLAALPRIPDAWFALGVLCGSVLIDLDHVPQYLGVYWWTAGTHRPHSHSLLTLVVLAALAILWRTRRPLMLGLLVGVFFHFWRDLSEFGGAGVPLLWPWSDHSYTTAHWLYLVTVAVLAILGFVQAARRRAALTTAKPAYAGAQPGPPSQ